MVARLGHEPAVLNGGERLPSSGRGNPAKGIMLTYRKSSVSGAGVYVDLSKKFRVGSAGSAGASKRAAVSRVVPRDCRRSAPPRLEGALEPGDVDGMVAFASSGRVRAG